MVLNKFYAYSLHMVMPFRAFDQRGKNIKEVIYGLFEREYTP